MTILRISKDCYLVGAVFIARGDELTSRAAEGEIERRRFSVFRATQWGAVTESGAVLFIEDTLDQALDMAAGAIEMLRPA